MSRINELMNAQIKLINNRMSGEEAAVYFQYAIEIAEELDLIKKHFNNFMALDVHSPDINNDLYCVQHDAASDYEWVQRRNAGYE